MAVSCMRNASRRNIIGTVRHCGLGYGADTTFHRTYSLRNTSDTGLTRHYSGRVSRCLKKDITQLRPGKMSTVCPLP